MQIRIAYEWTEDYVIKYLWSAAGYALIAVPILYTRTKRSLGIQPSSSASKTVKKGRTDRTDDAVAGRTESACYFILFALKLNQKICDLFLNSLHFQPQIAAVARRRRWAADVRVQGSSRACGSDDAVVHPLVDAFEYAARTSAHAGRACGSGELQRGGRTDTTRR